MAHSDIGLIGLGTMGAALSLNIADNGFSIAVFNRTTATTRSFHEGAGDLAERITPTESLAEVVFAIRKVAFLKASVFDLPITAYPST